MDDELHQRAVEIASIFWPEARMSAMNWALRNPMNTRVCSATPPLSGRRDLLHQLRQAAYGAGHLKGVNRSLNALLPEQWRLDTRLVGCMRHPSRAKLHKWHKLAGKLHSCASEERYP